MTNITRFRPFRGLTRFDPFGHELEDLFKGFFLTPISLDSPSAGSIPIDVTEDDKSYKVRAEMPGFSKEDIHVSVNGDQISISAETKKENEEKKGEQVVLKECYYGRVYRAFTLPQAVDDADATAKYEDGVLSLVLNKKASVVAKKITVG